MRVIVRSFICIYLVLIPCQAVATGQCKCTCRPSPPGGTTECTSEQIAICSDGGNGTCHGSCFDLPGTGGAADLAAAIFGKAFSRNISPADVRQSPTTFTAYLDRALESARSETTASFDYDDRTYRISFGMNEASLIILGNARARLA